MSDSPLANAGIKQPKKKGWLIFEGIVFLLIGILAIAFPYIMTIAVAQVIGIFAIIGGVFAAGSAIFGSQCGHRFSNILSGILFVLLGLALLIWVPQGILGLTLLLAAYFTVDGIFNIIAAIKNRSSVPAWPMLLINGIVSLILGGLIFFELPGTAAWAIGLLYGINMVFTGATFLTMAFMMPKEA